MRLRYRGLELLKRAVGTAEDFEAAVAREDWNLAIRRAQESVELALKAGILMLGAEPKHRHNEAIVRQLVTVAERAVPQFYPARWRDDSLQLTKKIGGKTTILASQSHDPDAMRGPIEIDRDGSTTAVYVAGRLTIQVTDTTYSLPLGSGASAWVRLTHALDWLGERRDPSFYSQSEFAAEDANRAGTFMYGTLGWIRREFEILPWR